MAVTSISDTQAEVYDRQLRLWGMQAQQRLMKSQVLVWGAEGTLIEVCKNLVLAGVSMTIRDHRVVEKSDVDFNYFLRPEDLGKSRADCAAQRIQEMNPLAKVTPLSEGGPEEEISQLQKVVQGFDVVCVGVAVVGWNVKLLRSLDSVCREKKAQFFVAMSDGDSGFFFSDMHEHTVEERSSTGQGGAGGDATKNGDAAEQAQPEQVSFPSFAEWLDCPAQQLRQEKVDSSILIYWLMLRFLAKEPTAREGELKAFQQFCHNEAPWVQDYGTFPECLSLMTADSKTSATAARKEQSLQQAYRMFFLEPLVPVAAVSGGLLAQEVIKAITRRDPPLVNCVCFSAATNAAFVERIPAMKVTAKKRKIEEVCDLD